MINQKLLSPPHKNGTCGVSSLQLRNICALSIDSHCDEFPDLENLTMGLDSLDLYQLFKK